jgi:hypothetical protein
MLMINNHFAVFQLPGNCSKPKKNAPYTRNLLFIVFWGQETKLHAQKIKKSDAQVGRV